MGFLKNLMKSDKQQTDDEDPEWAELKKFRDAQKMRIPGWIGSPAKLNGAHDPSDAEPDHSMGDSPLPPPASTESSPEYQCKQCNLTLKESWNRCPKCSGEIQPIGLDKSEDIRRLYPDQYPGKPVPGQGRKAGPKGHDTSPRAPTPPTSSPPLPPPSSPPASTGKAKKVRKVRKPGDSPTAAPGEDLKLRSPSIEKNGTPSPSLRTSSSRPTRSTTARDQNLDDLFNDDPLEDDGNGVPRGQTSDPKPRNQTSGPKPRGQTPSPKPRGQTSRPKPKARPQGSWKEVPPLIDHLAPAHTPPPEVKSMLENLMDSGVGKSDSISREKCAICGFRNPPGSWDFCMKCGHHF